MTIKDLEREIERRLTGLPVIPSGVKPKADLRYSKSRINVRKSIRDDASAEHFQPQLGDYIRVEFAHLSVAEPVQPAARQDQSPHAAVAFAAGPEDPATALLIRALDGAERAPGRTFVAIKSFRDQILPAAGLARDQASPCLSRAIESGLIRTGKVPNPHNPEFPTTTVRLDRSNARVISILSAPNPEAKERPRPRFEPLDLGPVSASEIVIRDRR